MRRGREEERKGMRWMRFGILNREGRSKQALKRRRKSRMIGDIFSLTKRNRALIAYIFL